MPTDLATGRPLAKRERSSRRRAHLAPSERIAAAALVGMVFLAVLAFGASDVMTATLFSGVYALYLLILLATCDWARRDLGRLPGLGIQATAFALLIAAVLWPLTAWGPGGPHPVWSYLPGQLGSLTVDRSALLLNVLQFFGLACLFVSARLIGASETRGAWFLRAALVALAAYATAALIDHVSVRRSARLVATLLSPNSAATTFGAGMLLAAAAAVNRFRRHPGLSVLRRGDPEAMAWLGVVALLASVLLLTVSRAGVVASLIGLGLMLAWNAFAQRQSLRGSAALIVGAAILLVAAVALRSMGELTDRFTVTSRDLEVRAIIFKPHWDAFLSTPWSGFGLGSFPTVNQLVITAPSLSELYNIRAAHNLYLQWLEEGGVVGAAAMLAAFALILWPVIRGGLADSSTGVWARATVCAALIFLVHGFTDFALQAPAIQALCALILGVVGSMGAARAGKRSASVVQPWPVNLAAGLTLLVAGLVAAPLVAARLGGDLSRWPTAPAEALAQSLETGLAIADPKPATLQRLERLSGRELALRPASGAAWLRKAAIEMELGHTEASSQALENSFVVAPLQTSLFDRRTIFAYEHWDQLSPNARVQTVYHLRAEWRRSGRPARFVAMANGLRNPAGRIGMALQVAVLRMSSR